ncbi:MAG: dTMP kinase [Candidatus Endomicrobiellum trichonymphae]|uniref:dTMP kinase n=1 Tax=Endomicrobium trichonymphae TaxID=1408204 RepID=UPI0027D38CE6|nr:MAG: dTMP kinase [Candidatus Endomicrobium trichonymphae]
MNILLSKRFITFEGGDGAGKTTHSLLLKKYLEKRGYEVLLTREPGGTILAEAVRRILLNPDSNIVPLSELFLYEAARAQHVEEFVLPALNAGKAVICDRFTDSTVAYQGYGRKLNLQLIDSLNSTTSFGLTPILTIYLDILPYKRAKKLNRIERESLQFHERVREGYLSQAKKYPERIKIVKTQETVEKTEVCIREIIDLVL